MPNKAFYEKHEGSIISGISFLVFILVGTVIANFVVIEIEKERSKKEDAKTALWQPKIDKIDSMEKYSIATRDWARTIHNKNVAQLQMINDLQTELARLQEQTKCLHKDP